MSRSHSLYHTPTLLTFWDTIMALFLRGTVQILRPRNPMALWNADRAHPNGDRGRLHRDLNIVLLDDMQIEGTLGEVTCARDIFRNAASSRLAPMPQHIANISRSLSIAWDAASPFHGSGAGIVRCKSKVNLAELV